MNKALRMALAQCRPGGHHAILLRDGVVVASSSNLRRPLTSIALSETSWRAAAVHAEQAVIKLAGSLASGAVLIVVRTNTSGQPMPSQPCRRCTSQIRRARISRVIHT